ncbi:MAG: dUTP diphosphatase [Bacilli bacterium]|nr:dUTP diphosphatase [Bacilli bacterium]
MLEVKFKKLVPEAVIPAYAKPGDAGLDLRATSKHWSDDFQCWIYGTGLAVEIPEGYVGLIFPRSSVRKYCLALTNSVGVIDSSYRGEIMCTFRPQSKGTTEVYNVGDRVCQLIIVPYPAIAPIEVKELSETERGVNGHGSTGV